MTSPAEPPRRHALVVEDDADAADLLRLSLERIDFAVVDVGSAESARGALAAHRFELVTVDVMLPDGDGLGLCREIRRSGDCYVIMVSARRDLTDRVRGLEAGADDYLVKPFSPVELEARVAALLRRPRAG